MATMSQVLSAKEHHALSHYLARYGEQEAFDITPFLPEKNYQHCLVIPCYKETDEFIQRLQKSPLKQSSLLLIIVINQPNHIDNTQHNQQLWDHLNQQYKTINSSATHQWLSIKDSTIDLLVIDRFTHKIPKKQGVGLARKIGGDIACQLLLSDHLQSQWIHHTDADTHLPANYFSAIGTINTVTQKCSAAIYPYTHIHEKEHRYYIATQYYEQALAYYVAGLKQAGSPYAFHTLGSCIATHAYYYAQVRGFPKKAGGEDFYLLNKLAKVGNITSLKDCVLQIDARHSDRVPFGTGPAVEKILAMKNPDTQYLYYHPQCFRELGSLLLHFNHLLAYQQKAKGNEQWLNQLSPALQAVLPTLGIDTLLTHISQQIHHNDQCIRHCHQWLDGFKTLKLIHLLEAHYPKQALNQCLSTQW